jgi:hypothetical protein
MKSSDQRIDTSLRAFARRWMKTFDRPRPSTTLGYFSVGLFVLFWSSSLSKQTGFNLNSIWGTLVFLGFVVILTLTSMLIVHILARLGIDRPTRSALLFSAVIGPYVNMLTARAWNISVVSHILGFLAGILAFLTSLLLDKLIAKPPSKQGED